MDSIIHKNVASLFLYSGIFFIVLSCSTVETSGDETLSTKQLLLADQVLSNLKKSQMSLDNKDYGSALSYIDSADAVIPDLAFAHFMRGLVYDQLNRLEDAETSYNNTLSIDSTFRDAWFRLGNNALAAEQYSKAVEYFKKEQGLYPRPEVLIKLAVSYANVYKPDSAQVVLQEAVKMDSVNAEARMLLGKILKDNGEVEEALKNMENAIRLDSTNLDYQITLGTFLFNLGQSKQAIAYLESAIQVNKWDFSAHYNLGHALIREGRKPEGEKYLAIADTLQSINARIGFLRTNLRSKPESLSDWTKLGYLLQSVENYSDAFQVFNIVSFLRPENLEVRENLAFLKLARTDTVGAIQEYRDILQEDPSRANTWFNVGVIYVSMGKFEAARHAWGKTLEQNPNDATAAMLIERLSKVDISSIFDPLN